MLQEANEVRRKMKLDNEDYIYKFICKNPELSIYEISKRLNWTIGKVQHYVNDLFKQDLLLNSEVVEKGRTKRLVRAKTFKELYKEIKEVEKGS